jgi:pimeloyl-ACP methyl ester carboxylesterase
MRTSTASIDRRFVQTRSGRLHIAVVGDGFPVLLLHQTPRSWNEYREVLPRLGQKYHAIAMDTVGFGDSEPLQGGADSIEAWAVAAYDLLDELNLTEVAIVGHHTGAAIAIEMAASRPLRVKALILSASPYVDAAQRLAYAGRRVIDSVDHEADGRHLLELWNMRRPLYPEGDVELLDRFMIDALKANKRAAGGHHVVRRYVMETRLPLVRCPTLAIAPTADERAYLSARRVADAIRGSQIIEVEGGMVPLPEQMPDRFARIVDDFLTQILNVTPVNVDEVFEAFGRSGERDAKQH